MSGSASRIGGVDDIYFDPMWDIRMTDTSLRDGSHHKRHQFTKDEVGAIVAALDAVGDLDAEAFGKGYGEENTGVANLVNSLDLITWWALLIFFHCDESPVLNAYL